jgi:hypothetical protein
MESAAKTAVNSLCVNNGVLYSAHGGSAEVAGTVELWRIGTYQSIQIVSIDQGPALHLAVSNDCCYVMTENTIQVMRCGSTQKLRTMGQTLSQTLSQQGNAGTLGSIHFIQAGNGKLISSFGGDLALWA